VIALMLLDHLPFAHFRVSWFPFQNSGLPERIPDAAASIICWRFEKRCVQGQRLEMEPREDNADCADCSEVQRAGVLFRLVRSVIEEKVGSPSFSVKSEKSVVPISEARVNGASPAWGE